MKKYIFFLLIVFGCTTTQHFSASQCPFFQNDFCEPDILTMAIAEKQCKSQTSFLKIEDVFIPVICFPSSLVSSKSYECLAGFKGNYICFKKP